MADEASLAKAVLNEARMLAENAEKEGVTAYLHRPAQRELRPNQRFLRNTIINLQHANKRAEEEEMWARRAAELKETGIIQKRRSKHSEDADDLRTVLKDKRSRKRSRSPSPFRGYTSYKEEENNEYEDTHSTAPSEDIVETQHHHEESYKPTFHNDDDVEAMLLRKKPRGRGGIGSRVDFTGPYLEREPGDEEPMLNEDYDLRKILGPSWPPPGMMQRQQGTMVVSKVTKKKEETSSESSLSTSSDSSRDRKRLKKSKASSRTKKKKERHRDLKKTKKKHKKKSSKDKKEKKNKKKTKSKKDKR